MRLAQCGAMVGPSCSSPCKWTWPRGGFIPRSGFIPPGQEDHQCPHPCVMAQSRATSAATNCLMEALVTYLLDALP